MGFDFDFYEILEVSKDVSKKDLKKAYRKLSQKYHPDKPDTGDEELFKKISIAYNILSNDKKRKLYDLGKWDELEPESEINLSEAEQNVIALFQSSIDSMIFGLSIGRNFLKDIAYHIKDNIEGEIDGYSDTLIKLNANVGRLRDLLPKAKFESKHTKFNLLQMAIQQIISLKEQEIDDIKIQLKLAKEMHGIISDFCCEDSEDFKKLTESILSRDIEIPYLEESRGRRSIGRRY